MKTYHVAIHVRLWRGLNSETGRALVASDDKESVLELLREAALRQDAQLHVFNAHDQLEKIYTYRNGVESLQSP